MSPKKNIQRWSVYELLMLKKFGKFSTVQGLCDLVNRAPSSVRAKLKELKIAPKSKYDKWEESEVLTLQFSLQKGMGATKIQKEIFPYRTLAGIKSKIQQL